VVRLFLAIWLAAFAVQSTDLLATVIPDECVEDIRGSAADPCPQDCARCVCCARVPIFVSPIVASPAADVLVATDPLRAIDALASAFPHGIFHVPKAL
jgi:hypothetical protein